MAFVKGKSGNPTGRKKAYSFVDSLMMELKEREADDRPGLRSIAAKLIDSATDGDLQAIKEVADRLDGKAAQAVKHSGEDGGNIIIRMITDDEQL